MEYLITNKDKRILKLIDKNITVIPDNIKNIQILDCRNCKFLTKIPNIPGLKVLYCFELVGQ